MSAEDDPFDEILERYGPFMKTSQITELFHVTPKQAREWARNGIFKASKVGRDFYFVTASVRAALVNGLLSDDEEDPDP